MGFNLNLFFGLCRNSCKIKYNNLFLSILFPILAVTIIWIYLLCGLEKSYISDFTIYHKIYSVGITPLIEEIAFRGIFLGMFFIELPKYLLKENQYRFWKYPIMVSGLLLVTVYFSFSHNYNLDLRYISGLLFGIFYLLDKQNLLPSILGHAINNFIVIFIAHC